MPPTRISGKIIAASTPACRLSPKEEEIRPVYVGPKEQPRSPPKARRANIALPPFILEEAILSVPGHIMPTARPHRAQPIRPITG